ncbi:MAG: ABC transporter ATP-binding protein, partial [Candidatus Dormibacterales bacterium]
VLTEAAPALPRPGSAPPPPPGSEVAWSARGLCAGPAGAPLLWDVELWGRKGEVVVLTGPNGAGKTTLLRSLAGLSPPLAGTVERPPGRTAYLPQDPSALLHLPTLRDEVAQTLRWSREPDGDPSILAQLGLSSLADRYPRDLSTGERQRAALATALAGRPALALLDEPTRGMDEDSRRALVGVVRRLSQAGTAVVLATHDARLAAEVGHRVLRVGAGRVTAAMGGAAP